MSKFEINRIIIDSIRSILRFRFTSLLPKWQENNIWIYGYLYSKNKMGVEGVIFESHLPNFENLYNFLRCSNDVKMIF